MKPHILGTGLSGLVGTKFVELYSPNYEFHNLDLTAGVDILNIDQVRKAFEESTAEVVIHFAAYTDTQKAFEQQGDKEGPAYKVNVTGTENIAKAAKEFGKYLIHISTAFVFDGEKITPYVETDPVHPIEWYGQTKAWAEEVVLKECPHSAIVRIDRPYRMDDFPRLDILHKVIDKLRTGSLPPQFADTSWTPTSIETLSEYFHWFIMNRPEGIFHATTDPIYSDYTFALWVKEKFNLPGQVQKGSLTEYLRNFARPYQRNTALDTSKLKVLMGK